MSVEVRGLLKFDEKTASALLKAVSQYKSLRSYVHCCNLTWRIDEGISRELRSILARLSESNDGWRLVEQIPNGRNFLMTAWGENGAVSGRYNGQDFQVDMDGFVDLLMPDLIQRNLRHDWQVLGTEVAFSREKAMVYVQDRYIIAESNWRELLMEGLVSHVSHMVKANSMVAVTLILVFQTVKLEDKESRLSDFQKEANRRLKWLFRTLEVELAQCSCSFQMSAHMVNGRVGPLYHDRYLVWDHYSVELMKGLSSSNGRVRMWYNIGRSDDVGLSNEQLERFHGHLNEDHNEPIFRKRNFVLHNYFPGGTVLDLKWPTFNIS